MRTLPLLLTLSLPVALAACGSNDQTASANNEAANYSSINEDVALGNESTQSAPSSAQEFADKATASDRFEIETSKLAAASASSSAVKSFAAKMISAHTESTAKLKSTLSKEPAAMTPNDALNPEQQSTLDGLKSKKGAEFDKAYAAAQVSGHEKTLAALKDYSAVGDNSALKGFADGLIPTVTEHLNEAKKLK